MTICLDQERESKGRKKGPQSLMLVQVKSWFMLQLAALATMQAATVKKLQKRSKPETGCIGQKFSFEIPVAMTHSDKHSVDE